MSPTVSPTEPPDQRQLIQQDFATKASTYARKYQVYTYETRSYHIRNQLTFAWLDKKGGKILEAGCGPAILTRSLEELGYCAVGVDLSPHNLFAGFSQLNAANISPRLVSGDLTCMPFANGTFDEIVSLGVLEYVLPIQNALEELHRLLRPGGQLIVSLPNRQSLHRWWERLVYMPVSQGIKRLAGRENQHYARLEVVTKEIPALFAHTGFEVIKYQAFAAQIVVQPFSRFLKTFALSLADRIEPLVSSSLWGKWAGVELLISARCK